jgi:hypothetical protein
MQRAEDIELRAKGGERSAKRARVKSKCVLGLGSRVSDCCRLQNGRFRDEDRRKREDEMSSLKV